ncbi:MAG: hypothetical protein AAB728_03945, partial [Patescibacteria group bacterium]
MSSDSSLSSASSSETSSEGSSSTSAEPPLDSARGEAGSVSSESSSTPEPLTYRNRLLASLFRFLFPSPSEILRASGYVVDLRAPSPESAGVPDLPAGLTLTGGMPDLEDQALVGSLFGGSHADASALKSFTFSFLGDIRFWISRIFQALSFFYDRSFFGLIREEESQYTFRVEEERAWQVLSLPLPKTSISATDLTLTPKGSESFDANTPPAFTLLRSAPQASQSFGGQALLDEEGNLKEEVALQAIVGAITGEDAYRKEVVKAIVEERKEEIAAMIAQDSLAVNDIAAAANIPEGRTKAQRVEEAIIAALGEDEARTAVAGAALGKEDVRDMAVSVLSPEVRDAVLRNIVAGETGEGAVPLGGVLQKEDPALSSLVSDSLVQAVQGDEAVKRDIAEAVLEAVRDQGPMTKDQGPMTNDQGPMTNDQGPMA